MLFERYFERDATGQRSAALVKVLLPHLGCQRRMGCETDLLVITARSQHGLPCRYKRYKKVCLELMQVFKLLDQVILQVEDLELAAHSSQNLYFFYIQLVQCHLFQRREKPLVVFCFLHV